MRGRGLGLHESVEYIELRVGFGHLGCKRSVKIQAIAMAVLRTSLPTTTVHCFEGFGHCPRFPRVVRRFRVVCWVGGVPFCMVQTTCELHQLRLRMNP